jgi:excisionase family DNA binding protein
VDGFPEKRNRERRESSGPDERPLTVRQVAELLSVSRATVYTLMSRGVLPHLRCSNAIRVRPNDLERYCTGAHESSWR